jgi:predicted nucleotidyltransferase
MEELADQFKKALARIQISGKKRDRAIDAHTEIRGVLEGSEKLRSLGVETVLIGSYARDTGIYPGKDVDVFVKLTKLDTSAPPEEVYNAVRDVLVAKYGKRAEEQPRSIKVSFDEDGDGFAVDAVPAVRMGSRWAIPRRDRDRWQAPDTTERWVETDPEQLGKLTERLNPKLKVEGQGAYVPTVKLVRQTRRHHMRDRKPGGLYFELLAYSAFVGDAVSGDSFADIFAGTLKAIAAQLASGQVVTDPVLEREYRPTPDAADLARAAQVFAGLAAKADEALRVDKCKAALRWREILGSNDRGPCFEFPPGCDERGEPIRRVREVAAVGSKEAGSFANRDA